jgi:hypothetical protein
VRANARSCTAPRGETQTHSKACSPPLSQAEKSTVLDEQDLADIDATYGGIGGASLGFTEDLSAELATEWLREHDTRRTLIGVERELESVAKSAGLTLDIAQRLCFSRFTAPSRTRALCANPTARRSR